MIRGLEVKYVVKGEGEVNGGIVKRVKRGNPSKSCLHLVYRVANEDFKTLDQWKYEEGKVIRVKLPAHLYI